jgi:hypothetical protein
MLTANSTFGREVLPVWLLTPLTVQAAPRGRLG